MNISIIGTGYVGLVSGVCFAETGNNVLCVDVDAEKIKKLSSGKLTIYEPGLEAIFSRNLLNGKLNFTTDLKKALKFSEIIFLCLPTPPNEDGSADLKYVLDVSEEIGKIISKYKIIVSKSTVPVGTADKIKNKVKLHYDGAFDVVSNPEFLKEGVAVNDFMKPERVVIGLDSEKVKNKMELLYKPFIRQGNPIIFMDLKSSELTKYAANSFLATKISFMNEIANLCEKLGANVDLIRKGIGSDSRIGKRFLFPGIGYGGSCFPKDVKALVKSSTNYGYDFKILKSVIDVNQIQKTILLKKIKTFFDNNLNEKKFALWGLSFKPNTDDIREAPSLEIINELLAEGSILNVFDPEATQNVKDIYGDKLNYFESQYDCLENTDALIIATEWNEFRTLNFSILKNKLKNKVIFDGRNLYDKDLLKKEGLKYYSIGRE